MKLEHQEALGLPESPDSRVLEPEFSTFEKKELVTLRGYLGKKTSKTINLHQVFDFGMYYQIPLEGIVSCKPEDSDVLGMHALEVYKKTSIRYFHVTTVDLTAGALACAVETHQKFGANHEMKLPLNLAPNHTCGCTDPECCTQTGCNCASSNFPTHPAYKELFGLIILTPEDRRARRNREKK